MNTLLFTERFDSSFSRLKDKKMQRQIWKKILKLETLAPLGKKLKGNPYWSIHVGRCRIIYQMDGQVITVADLLLRKHGYREF